MKLKAQIHSESRDTEWRDIEIQAAGNQIAATIGDRQKKVEVRQTSRDTYLVFAGTRLYECRVTADTFDVVHVSISGRDFAIAVSDPKRFRNPTSGSGAADRGPSQIVAPMPGKIVRVLVEQGASVEQGERLLVIEAMKMQNEMKAPKAGKVISMAAQVGATVNAGDVLVIIL